VEYFKIEGLTQIALVELSSEYYYHILMLYMLDELIDAELSDRFMDFFHLASYLISNIVDAADPVAARVPAEALHRTVLKRSYPARHHQVPHHLRFAA
jgi:hypothetical protein